MVEAPRPRLETCDADMINYLVPPRRLGFVAALLVALVVAPAVPASAHTRLVSSSPGRDSTVRPPSEVELVFSDKIRSARVVVTSGGRTFHTGAPRLSGRTVTQPLRGTLPTGDYTVAWRVVGADGHPITSEQPLRFTVDSQVVTRKVAPVTPLTLAATTRPNLGITATAFTTTATESGSGGARWLMLGSGLLVGVGIGFAFVMLRKRPRAGGNDRG
jgi:copper resistance protein C